MTQNIHFEDGTLMPSTLTTLACNYASLVNNIGFNAFGLRPTGSDVITDSVASVNQAADILRSISKGLQFVYSAHRWSFLRSPVSITTYAAYKTGTITVNVSGVVTGVDTTFPAYSASAGGWLSIPSVGSFAVATYSSGTSLTLTGYNAAAVTVASIYSLSFNSYPLPLGVDSLEGRLTYPQGNDGPREVLDKVLEVEIRRMLAHNNTPGRPRFYAETMKTFDPIVGSARYVTFHPIPDIQYTLTAVGTLRPTMIDGTNQYPLGVEVLAPCIIESCLAAAERDIEGKDAAHPDAVHSRALVPLLAMAIQIDKDRSSPDTLGVDHGREGEEHHQHDHTGGIYWNGGGGFSGFI
jgi:hypothetical protein